MLRTLVSLLSLVLVSVTHAAPSKSSEEAAIRKTIDVYINGAIQGNSELMAQAFSKDAYVYGIMDGETLNGPATNLTAWTATNVPAKDLKYKITRMDVEGTVATVRLELDGWNERERAKPEAKEKKRKYTDMLSLLKTGDEWKIVGKVFHTHN